MGRQFRSWASDNGYVLNLYILAMSILFNVKRENITDLINIDTEIITIRNLRALVAKKLTILEHEVMIINPVTGKEFMLGEIVKKDSTILVEKKLDASITAIQPGEIISKDQLEQMAQNAKFFLIKSSNEENIQKARDYSVWATTYSNQERLRYAFNYTENVFLIFTTNRSYELKGLARMENQPGKIPDKSFWSGVSNIRLGGNFKIKWVRKKPISYLQIEKAVGIQAKDELIRACDGFEVDAEMCRQIAQLFQLPSEPYYPYVELKQPNVPKEKVANLSEILGKEEKVESSSYGGILVSPHQMLINSQLASLMFQNLQTKEEGQQNVSDKDQKKKKSSKHKKDKKDKREKKKRHRRHSSSESESSSSESSSHSDRKKRIKKGKRHKKHKHSKRGKSR